jgi:catechol 2,3-dioxygenase-like lactoylglutathione lyase family enzyme
MASRTLGFARTLTNLPHHPAFIMQGTARADVITARISLEYRPMSNMTTIEVKAFVPARDFALSKRFYEHLGFEVAWSSDDLAYLRHDHCAFLLQNFYNEDHAGNFMMHLLVEDVDAWWRHVEAQGLVAKYGVKLEPPADRPWGMRDFVVVDPTGVLWRIAHNLPQAKQPPP